MATGDLHKKFCADRSSACRNMLADRQTQTGRHADRWAVRNTQHPYTDGVNSKLVQVTSTAVHSRRLHLTLDEQK